MKIFTITSSALFKKQNLTFYRSHRKNSSEDCNVLFRPNDGYKAVLRDIGRLGVRVQAVGLQSSYANNYVVPPDYLASFGFNGLSAPGYNDPLTGINTPNNQLFQALFISSTSSGELLEILTTQRFSVSRELGDRKDQMDPRILIVRYFHTVKSPSNDDDIIDASVIERMSGA